MRVSGGSVSSRFLIDSMIVDQLDAHERAIVLSILNGDSTVDVLGLRTTLSATEFKEARDRLIQRRLITVHSLERSAEEVPA
jgi:hypothetical protein